MAQLSRPFQIALLALVALVLAWFAVLHRPGGSSTSSSAPRASAAGASAAKSSPNGDPSRVYHGPVPGLEGLTRDIKRAHEASATSQRSGQEIQSKAAQASNEAASGSTTHEQASGSASKSTTATAHRTHRAQRGPAAAAPSKSAAAATGEQAVVASELKQGKVVLLLFWNPRSSDDVAVDGQVKAAAHKLGGHVALHTASASQVNSFGSITREIQVYQTPTLLIVNPKGQVTTLTGYTDAFAIEQTVAEVGN